MSNDLHHSDEEIHRLLRHIKAEQKLAPASDEVLAEAKSEETSFPPHVCDGGQRLNRIRPSRPNSRAAALELG